MIDALWLVGSPLLTPVYDEMPPSPWRDHVERLVADPAFRDHELGQIPDSAARAYLLRLAGDEAWQRALFRHHQEVVLPALVGAQEQFRRAFGPDLRVVRLDVTAVEGYEYRDSPDLIEGHVRSFLDEIGEREWRRSGVSPAGRAGPSNSDTVKVAPPTGEQPADRASIVAALEGAEPGATILFAPGTYLVGDLIRVETPRLTLLGHPDGTTLRGCEPDTYEVIEARLVRGAPEPGDWPACGLLELTGGHVTVRGLTFEYSRMGLLLGCCQLERRFRMTPGSYLIEGNTFRNSLNGIRPWATEPSTIRGNRFTNTFHAVSGAGSGVRIVDNEISVPEPGRVPGTGHPSFAIALSPIWARTADSLGFAANGAGFVVAGNRIEGHPDGIVIFARPGTRVRDAEIHDNTIRVERVPLPPAARSRSIVDIADPLDATIVGVPLSFYPFQDLPEAPDEVLEEGSFEGNVIAGNRILGAEGVGIAIRRGFRNRIVGNSIEGIQVRDPFPGNTVVSWSAWWHAANGSGIWISPGSDRNEIAGNTFEDIADAAVVIEGDSNRVELRSAGDSVRDQGRGNQVSGPGGSAGAAAPAQTGTLRSARQHRRQPPTRRAWIQSSVRIVSPYEP
jgi:hypothetical protein